MDIQSKKSENIVYFDKTILKGYLDGMKKSILNSEINSQNIETEVNNLKKKMNKINEKLSTLI